MDRNYNKEHDSNNENRGRKVVSKSSGNSSSGSSRPYGQDRNGGRSGGESRFGSRDGNRGDSRQRDSGFNRNTSERSGNERREYRSDRPSPGGGFNREGRDRKPYAPEGGGYRREGGFRQDSRPPREIDGNRSSRDGGERRFSRDSGGRSFNRENTGGERRFSREGGERRQNYTGGERSFNREGNDRRPTHTGGERSYNREGGFNREDGAGRDGGERRFSRSGGEGRFNRENSGENSDRTRSGNRSENDRPRYNDPNRGERSDRPTFRPRGENDRPAYTDRRDRDSREFQEISEDEKQDLRQKHYSKKKQLEHQIKNVSEATELRLNRYISMAGVCSRRDADALIKAGRVKVNDVVVQLVGTKVKRKDKVEMDGNVIIPERKVYLVLNKPKDFVTTVEDPLERKTVMSLVEGACKERIYPVGRLDRMTTGVLLFTNDGDMAKKLTHPKFNHKKIYHVFSDRVVKQEDMDAMIKGIELEDGFVQADDIRYVSDDMTEVGIEIHSGKNRIVRRIFEHFGYQISKLDRVYFAGITKKNIPRSKWRFLTTEEVDMLKFY